MHTLLDLRGNIPSFIHISDGKLHDVHALDMLLPEAGAIYVVDRGYVDFARLYVLHQAGAFFVTRAKSNIDAHRVYSAPTDRSTGIICDQTISLDGFYTRQDYPELLRRIRFKDPESGKTLVFITNNFSLPAATICALYKSRWQVELFFKWIKQHLRIKQFYGTSENAVKTQIWIAVSVYVLVAIVKNGLLRDMAQRGRLKGIDPEKRPSDLKPEEIVSIYGQYFDDVLKTVGGRNAIDTIKEANAAAAFADAMFSAGAMARRQSKKRLIV